MPDFLVFFLYFLLSFKVSVLILRPWINFEVLFTWDGILHASI